LARHKYKTPDDNIEMSKHVVIYEGKGKVTLLQARLWPRGGVEV